MFDTKYIDDMVETERACSMNCMRVNAKEIAINTINKTYINYFNLDKVSEDIEKYLDAL